MKPSRYTLWMVPCLTLAISSRANQLHEWVWDFTTNNRTNVPTTVIANPTDAIATAVITGLNNTYFFGAGPDGLYGTTQTGLWDINGGQLMVVTDIYTSIPVENLAVKLTHF